MPIPTPEMTNEIIRLRAEVAAVRRVLCTALAWMAQSANSPLRVDEVRQLIAEAESGSHP